MCNYYESHLNTLTTMRDRKKRTWFDVFIYPVSIWSYIRHRLQRGEKHFINFIVSTDQGLDLLKTC